MSLPKGFAALLLGALYVSHGLRTSRRGSVRSSQKVIGGVPVLNYDQAYSRRSGPSAGDTKEPWILVAQKGVSDAQLRELCSKSSTCQRVGHPSQGGVPYFKIVGTEQDLEGVVSGAADKFVFIEPDTDVFLVPEIASAVQSSESWGLSRIGVATRHEKQGAGVHVYVVDTGIRVGHQDFGGRAVPTLVTAGDAAVECDAGDQVCAADTDGHGTHCAGSVAGKKFGVAPKATVHAVKVFKDDGSSAWSFVYDALDWVATKGARPAVISMSLGGSGNLEAMQVAVETAVGAGVTVVVAAGNDNSDACRFTPAFVQSAIAVGSTTSNDTRSSFSNFGECIDLWAPGSDIASAGHVADDAVVVKSGTSMACPHVSGAAALLLAADGDLTPAGVLQKLQDTAELGAIAGLKPTDSHKFLWVGSQGAPQPAPTPPPPPDPFCPEWARFPSPLWGECWCPVGELCSTDGGETVNCPTGVGEGGRGGTWFLWTCQECRCYADIEAVSS